MASRNPKMCFHARDKSARIWLYGRWVSLGRWGSPEAVTRYRQLVAEWRSAGARSEPEVGDLTVGLLACDYLEHVQRTKSAQGQLRVRLALRELLAFEYAPGSKVLDLPVASLRPVHVEDFRFALVRRGLSRGVVNERIWYVKDMFRWGARREIVSADVWYRMSTIQGLRAGEQGACDRAPIRPVARAFVETVLPHLSDVVAAMVRVNLETAARPGEVCAMTTGAIDTTGPVWLYRPAKHKTMRFGHERVIAIGAGAQRVLAPFLRGDLDAPIFQPCEAVEAGKASRSYASPYALSRALERAARRAEGFQGAREPGNRYTAGSYRRAVQRACDAAYPPPKGLSGTALARWREEHRFHPNQLRHTRLTEVRRTCGLDGAQAAGGHSKVTTTQVYAELSRDRAIEVAARMG